MFTYNRSDFTNEELIYVTCQYPNYPKIVRMRNIAKYVTFLFGLVFIGYQVAHGLSILRDMNVEFYNDPYIDFTAPETESSVIGQHMRDDTVTLSDVIMHNDYLSRGLAIIIAVAIFATGGLLLFVFGVYHLINNANDEYKKKLDRIRMELHTGMAVLTDNI